MSVRLPGYITEPDRHGNTRHRVRVAGNKNKRITLPIGPDHPQFLRCYEAARQGHQLALEEAKAPIQHSLAWLIDKFVAWMETRVRAELLHSSTLNQRQMQLNRIRERYGDMHMLMPSSKIAEIRDEMIDTPAAADNMVKAVKAMYAWASSPERSILAANPATGISRVGKDIGATPWTVEDLKQYRERHPQGTMAHLALSLFMFTACRISDGYRLGSQHEREIQGTTYLDWIPIKKGSSRVIVPILPPLQKAIDTQILKGPTYLLTEQGISFSSRNSFDNRFRKWVIEAGLSKTNPDGRVIATRSSHGIRKATGHLLALEGASQYHIMAVHGHTEAKTSEIYTKGVSRAHLAKEAMDLLAGMSW